MENELKEEAINRMKMLRMSKQCIEAFKKGEVWESEGIGALYECNEKEKKYIKDFEEKRNCLVYHIIHNIFEFGECYTMLYVSNDVEEWEMDRNDIKDLCPFAYVKNIDDEWCSEFGQVAVMPSIGGLVRIN